MARPPSRRPRLGFLLAGLLLGFSVLFLVVRLFVHEAELERVEASLRERVRLPEEAFELEEILPDRSLRIALREVAILDEAGDTVVSAPRMRLVFDAASLVGDGPLVFRDVVVEDPLLSLVKQADGEWNVMRAFELQVAGETVGGAEEVGRGIILGDVRITGGRLLLATPWNPADSASLLASPDPQLAQIGGSTMIVRTARALEARIPMARFGGEDGWRVEIAQATALLTDPEVGEVALRGWAEEAGEGFRFALDQLRTGRSRIAGQGTVGLGGEIPDYDLTLRAAPLALADLRWLRPGLTEEGAARFEVDVDSRPGGRTAFAFRDAEIRVRGSRASGQLTVITAENADPVFVDTRVALEPLLLSDLEALGLVESLPYTGRVTGTLASVSAMEGAEGSLRIDLSAAVTPAAFPEVPASELTARGLVSLGGEDASIRFRDLRVEAEPLYLAALSPFMEQGRERLRGVIRGSALLSGTPADLRIGSGLLSYEVGDAPPTRLRVSAARISTQPTLTYSVEARAEPLALATLTELFPSLPFRDETLGGPLTVSGNQEGVRFDADLSGSAGGIALRGTASFGEPLRFDVSGSLQAFRAAQLLTAATPTEGPLSGSFAARGTAEDFRFDVDLAQAGGSFALDGRVRGSGALPRQFEVAGRAENFRIGALIGRPGLLPSPMTGNLALTGGGRQPYRFDVDLRGGIGALDLEGFYAAGPVPRYAASGTVAGLNLEDLPRMGVLPATSLTGAVELRGEGTTLETLAGNLSFRSTGPSTAGGIPVETAVAQLTVRDGILAVDELRVALGGAVLTAEGVLGLTRPAPGVLRYSLVAGELATLAVVMPPPGPLEPAIAGSLSLTGWVGGSLRNPEIAAALRGDGLRFQKWRAGTLVGSVRAARAGEQWVGEGAVQGERLAFPGGETLQALRLEVNATSAAASFGLFARRNEASEVTASGALEFAEGELRGALLQTLSLGAGETRWQLAAPTRLQWGGIDGIAVDSLLLERSGAATGWILVDGRLPPTGLADLRIRAENVDLAELRRIVGRGPEIAGLASLTARIEGPVEEPEMELSVAIDSLRFEGASTDRLVLNGQYQTGRFRADGEAWIAGEQVLSLEAGVPLSFTWKGLAPVVRLIGDGALTGRIEADSVPLGLVVASLPGVSEGGGVFDSRILLGGTPDDPQLGGYADIRGGAVRIDTLGVRIDEINGRFALEGNQLRVDSLAMRSGGYARINGTVQVDADAPEAYLTAAFSDFHVVDRRDLADLLISGQLALSGRLPTPVLSGRLILDEGTIYIPEIADTGAEFDITDADIGEIGADTLPEGFDARAAILGGLRIEGLELVVEPDVWIDSDDARVQISGELLVNHSGGTPLLYGELQAVRGTYSLKLGDVLERDFDIVRGRVEFYGSSDINPALDIVAAHEVRTVASQDGSGGVLRILVNIGGTLQEPRISLTSDTRPPLPEEELFNYLVFGAPSFALGAGTGQLAQQIFLESFLTGYIAGELERTLTRSGVVDFVRVRTGPVGLSGGLGLGAFESVLGLGAATLELGKEVADGLFLTMEFGSLLNGAPTLGFGVEWEIDQNWSVRAAREVPRGQTFQKLPERYGDLPYQWSADVFWSREFGHPQVESPPLIPREANPLPGAVAPLPAPAPTPDPAPPPAPDSPPAPSAVEDNPRTPDEESDPFLGVRGESSDPLQP